MGHWQLPVVIKQSNVIVFYHQRVQHLECSMKALHKKTKFSIKDCQIKCDGIPRKLWIWSHLLKKSLMKNLFVPFKVLHSRQPIYMQIFSNAKGKDVQMSNYGYFIFLINMANRFTLKRSIAEYDRYIKIFLLIEKFIVCYSYRYYYCH